jgi:hypothetical protein
MTELTANNRVERAEQQKSCEQQQLRCVDIIDSYKQLNDMSAGTANGGKSAEQNDYLEIEKFDDIGSITGGGGGGGGGGGAAGSPEKAAGPKPNGSEATQAPCAPGGGGGRIEIQKH